MSGGEIEEEVETETETEIEVEMEAAAVVGRLFIAVSCLLQLFTAFFLFLP
jgi:hypothetical protein